METILNKESTPVETTPVEEKTDDTVAIEATPEALNVLKLLITGSSHIGVKHIEVAGCGGIVVQFHYAPTTFRLFITYKGTFCGFFDHPTLGSVCAFSINPPEVEKVRQLLEDIFKSIDSEGIVKVDLLESDNSQLKDIPI
jgi:hypothetical protein